MGSYSINKNKCFLSEGRRTANESRNFRDSSLANSKPSVNKRGWTPYLSFTSITWKTHFIHITSGTLHQFAYKQYSRCGSVSLDHLQFLSKKGYSNVILSCSGTGNEGSGRMLNLHLVEKNIAVLGEFDLSRTVNKHFKSALGTYNKHNTKCNEVPRLVFKTSCIPVAAVIWTAIACCFLIYSALGFRRLILDIEPICIWEKATTRTTTGIFRIWRGSCWKQIPFPL